MITGFKKSFYHSSFLLYGMVIFPVLLGSITAEGATYYVATTGSDSNPGTSGQPWRNPKKCASSPIQAGDTCIIQSGKYSDPSGNGILVYVSGNSPTGTSSQPITIKSESPLGAVMTIPSNADSVNAAFYITRPYYIIEGFDISGGDRDDSSISYAGIVFARSATGGIAKLNSIHHIARTVCSNSAFGFSGLFVQGTYDVRIEHNQIYSIGRLREGENECSTKLFQNDHGIYIEGATNVIVQRNVFYDISRGFPIHVYKSGGTTTNLAIYHNTFSGHSPTGKPVGHILLASTLKGATIKNNISCDSQSGMIVAYSLTASDVTVSYNLSDALEKVGSRLAGITFANNIERSTSLGFVDWAKSNFRLTPKSSAINRGTTVGVPPVEDGAPDIGAYEFSEQDSSTPKIPVGVAIQ